jgi:hypothetical protein
MKRVGGLLIATALAAGCGTQRLVTYHDSVTGVSFQHPSSWSVTGFSRSNSPTRLVLASYRVTRSEVEGDCGGSEALAALPKRGVAVLLIDYGTGLPSSEFPLRPNHMRLSGFKRANYDCFGDSYMRRFSVGGIDFQAHIAVGRDAASKERNEALRSLESLKVTGR